MNGTYRRIVEPDVLYAEGLIASGVPAQSAMAMTGVPTARLTGCRPPARREYVPPPPPPAPTPVPEPVVSVLDEANSIIREVADRHGRTLRDLKGSAQYRSISWPRQEAMFEVRKRLGLSLPRIGRIFGGMHHTTVLHGVRAHQKRLGRITVGGGQP